MGEVLRDEQVSWVKREQGCCLPRRHVDGLLVPGIRVWHTRLHFGIVAGRSKSNGREQDPDHVATPKVGLGGKEA